MKRVVLAYSGGLDTSAMIPWLTQRDYEVVAVLVDAGRAKELEALATRARTLGAKEAYVVPASEEFAANFVAPALQSNALYEGRYPLVSALSRPLIAKQMVEVARQTGASALAHGCTAKGNDQVRFDQALRALAPDLELLAPAREWGMTRDALIDFVGQAGVQIPLKKGSAYSIDENLWGRTVECGLLEDPWVAPPPDAYATTVDPQEAPDTPDEVEIIFETGLPVALNGVSLELADLIEQLDTLGGAHGFGRVDMMENRLVGIKSREVYEVPGALALIMAHRDLEDLTLPRDLLHYKSRVELDIARLIYNGQWYDPLTQALFAFVAHTQARVSGTVRLRFFKGSATVMGRRSPYSLYDFNLATYGGDDRFSHDAARGFCDLYGLPVEIWARAGQEKSL